MSKVINVLLMLLINSICSAQDPQLNELHFNHLSIKDGLPEAMVNASLQDKEGYMWIGTQAGLVRYDGYATKLYKFDLDDPIHSLVNAIYEDRSGELWIAVSYEGLYKFSQRP